MAAPVATLFQNIIMRRYNPYSCKYCKSFSCTVAAQSGWCLKKKVSVKRKNTCDMFQPVVVGIRYEQEVKQI